MSEPKVETAPQEAAHRESFFRQSGWLMIANVAGGFFMWAVHLLNKKIPEGQYGAFGWSLAVAMLVPTIPLQMIMAQQTAKALATKRQHELAGVMRWIWLATSALWLVCAAAVLVFQNSLVALLGITPAILWFTMAIVLLSLWMPLFWGLLQGKQNFLWLGLSMLSNAVVRFAIAAVAVLILHEYAIGMIAGVLIGMVIAGSFGAWHSRSLWLAKAEPFDWRALFGQVAPLFIGFLGFQALFTADTIFVKASFSAVNADYYVSGGTLSRALMWLVLPLASVMFPRIVHSAARAEKTDLMTLVLIGTAILAIVGALSLVVLAPWIVPLAYKGPYLPVVQRLLPWYLAAMVPLAIANVLLNNLLARPASKLALSLCILGLAIGYLFALVGFHARMVTASDPIDGEIMVLRIMGFANVLLLATCSAFTWGTKRTGP